MHMIDVDGIEVAAAKFPCAADVFLAGVKIDHKQQRLFAAREQMCRRWLTCLQPAEAVDTSIQIASHATLACEM